MGETGTRVQAAKIFLKAASYIRTYGWQKTGMGIYGQPRCSMGALASAQSGTWDKDVSALMYRELRGELRGVSLTQFNYHHDGEQVARLFEKVAAKLQKQREMLYN
jgi:hypothetical protein